MDEPVLHHPWGVVSSAFWAGAESSAPSPAVDVHGHVDGETDADTDTDADADADGDPTAAEDACPDMEQELSSIRETAAAGRHEEALLLTEDLDSAITATRGEVHLDTIQVREIRGYLAGLTGDPVTGLDWYLRTLRLRARLHGPHSPDTEAAARRAYSLWRTLPADTAQDTAPTLLATLTETMGPDSPAAKWTRRRSAELAAAPPPAPDHPAPEPN
ncbi:hypothetical protein Slala03_75780 [Streptomyces lavendulae subsp. lavendulae]|uniref:hypothetical protein n=1 Tax=Streptomyces lavendulae TaxID=1914 RepID=UPI0024A194E8|nr:hypothetical protein [Streptomyces lavendulae]GLV87889.1 hypothetical protein Slala03_75780 [Streptomyces lavendulae subsp. lavendulae]